MLLSTKYYAPKTYVQIPKKVFYSGMFILFGFLLVWRYYPLEEHVCAAPLKAIPFEGAVKWSEFHLFEDYEIGLRSDGTVVWKKSRDLYNNE